MSRCSATYYIPTDQLLGGSLYPQSGALSPDLETLSPDLWALSPDQEQEALLAELTPEMRSRLEQLGQRSRDKDRLREALVAICGQRFFSADELARITGRNPEYLQKGYLSSLIAEGRLRYRYPDDLNHPQQGYGLPDSIEN